MISDGLLHADIATLYEKARHGDVAPSPETITRIRAAEDQRDAAGAETVGNRSVVVDGVVELRTLAAQILRRTANYERHGKSRHIAKPRRDGKVPPSYIRPDPWQLASSAGVVFAAHPATVHETGPRYTFDEIVASRPVSTMHDDAMPHYSCDFRGPSCGPQGTSRAVLYVAVPDGQYLVLFGLCWGCESTVADLAGPSLWGRQ